MDISDGESDADSDYNSVDAVNDQDEDVDEAQNRSERALQGISSRRRREVHDIWLALRDGDAKSTAICVEKALKNNASGLWTTILSKAAGKKGQVSTATDSRTLTGSNPIIQLTKQQALPDATTTASSSAAAPKKGRVAAKKASTAPVKSARNVKAQHPVKGKKTAIASSSSTASSTSSMSASARARTQRALSHCFGASAAETLLARAVEHVHSAPWEQPAVKASKAKGSKARGSKTVAAKALEKEVVPVQSVRRRATSAAVTAAVKTALKKVARKTIVTETRRFAGRTVQVETTAMQVKSQFADDSDDDDKRSKAAASAESEAATAGGLDNVLNTIKGPKAITTVTKSAFDWQSHKAKEGLEDDLQQASKGGGYLGRSDFLQRVDVRTYEKERDARVMERASRKK
jgi:trimeric autotransporter adhesin